MPGAPPIGTTLDVVFLFPCLALVATMFVRTGGHLLWRESRLLRSRTIHGGGPVNVPDEVLEA